MQGDNYTTTYGLSSIYTKILYFIISNKMI